MSSKFTPLLSLSMIILITVVSCGGRDGKYSGSDSSTSKDLVDQIRSNPNVEIPEQQLLKVGQDLNEKTKHADGRVVLEKLVKDFPGNPIGKLLLANNYRETTDFNEALALYNEVAQIDSIRFLVLAERARVYILLDEFEKAKKDVDECKGLEPKYFGGFLADGLLQYAQGDADGALNLFAIANELDPGLSAEASLFAGYILLSSGINLEALEKFTRAIQVGKFINKGYAFINRGVAQLNLADSAYACRDFDSAYYYMPQESMDYITKYCEGVQRK